MKVTKAMIDAAESRHHEWWCGTAPDHKPNECEGGMPRQLVRSMLEAAARTERSDAANGD